MAAVFHGLGRCFVFAKYRTLYTYQEGNYRAYNGPQGWIFIGTCVTSPEVDMNKITSPVNIDKLGPAPVNRIYHSENHVVTVTLNVIDYTNYMGLKARGTEAKNGILRGDAKNNVGTLMSPVEDVELLLLWDAQTGATDTPIGRRYFSASPLAFRETTENTRILEAGIVFHCAPILLKVPKNPPAAPKQPVPSKPIRIVADFPDPNKGFKIQSPFIFQNGLPPIYLPYLDLSVTGLPKKSDEEILDQAFNNFVAKINKQQKKNGPKVDESVPISPPPPTTSSPIPTDDYIYYLYTEISTLL